ncbi:HAMP domain-containing sensor histidine kinase [Reinekea marina]|uniref:histidine kinase n=1 Tax=Reinekea marina TaxID=1310421 RepID=A0ABV7WSA3_9GAMM|nr:HAMP domain-containing sensor histidine kinase [Reinekea marina]MDN3650409.1 HAMP domain-containing sensor histidine kinase [Reinekea marina]
MDLFKQLFSDEFMPHGMCYLWQSELLWLHVISDAFIFFSYVSIPITLVYILNMRRDLVFSKVMALFGAFVLLCGITHAIAVWNVWNGTYWLSGSVKAVTAVVSVATAYMLWKLAPTLRDVPTVKQLSNEVEQRKVVEANLQEKTLHLKEESGRIASMNEELKAFAYASSHDLKSPLRGIKQLAVWIEEDLKHVDSELPPEIPENFELMKTRVTRMERLLDDLLEYSEIGKTEGSSREVETSTLCSEVFDLVGGNDSGLTLKLESSLPIFKTHHTPFTQVIRNLIDNAIKHHDKPNGTILVKALEHDNQYEFIVEDDGPGVPESQMERVVELFTTLKPKDECEGSGMGLAIIKKIIANYGGEMRLTTNSQGGLSVSFTWPKNID